MLPIINHIFKKRISFPREHGNPYKMMRRFSLVAGPISFVERGLPVPRRIQSTPVFRFV